jgi:hypothetical protein
MRNDICKLCLQTKPICKSHLIPAAAYRRIVDARGNQRPILNFWDPKTQKHSAIETSGQLQEYLLCEDCEQMLTVQGEDWVIPRLAGEGPSPLYEVISKQKPYVGLLGDELIIYKTLGLPEFEKQKLVHFAMGVFFKSAAYQWRMAGIAHGIDLGPYLESVRRFVLGESEFPERLALWFVITPPTAPFWTILPPHLYSSRARLSKQGFHMFSFCIPGLEFVLCVGKQISPTAERLCFATSPDQLILVNAHSTMVMARKSLQTLQSGAVFGKLRKLVQP